MYYAEHMVLVFSLMSFVFLLLFLTEIINLLTNIDLSSLIFFIVIQIMSFLFYTVLTLQDREEVTKTK